MAAQLAGKSPQESMVTMTEIVLPTHTNSLGSIFGGTVMSWIDIAGAIAAGRHARQTVVTASVDALHFIAPIKLGHVVRIVACVNRAFKTSMEVGVRVEAENPKTGETNHTVTAYITFVAIDDNNKPVAVPPILPKTSEEKRRFEEALTRKDGRAKARSAMGR